MKKRGFWQACALTTAFLAALPANAIVMLSGDYLVRTTYGDSGVAVGDAVHVSAFYDPLHAQLQYQDQSQAVFSFAAEYAGLSFTVGDLVWRTTGPLTIKTDLDFDNLGQVKSVGLNFLGYTRVQQTGVVPTTLETPWSSDVIDNQFMLFGQAFEARVGLNPADVLQPRLYTEADLESLLTLLPGEVFGISAADTTTGNRNFNLLAPTDVPPVASVPEPSTLMLFAFGLLALVAFGRRSPQRPGLAVAA
jgi:hypothetical protein